jgi:hypothetical protein
MGYKDKDLLTYLNYPTNPLKNNPSRWQIKKLAYKVKQILSILTGIPVEDMEKEKIKKSYLGEEWNRYKVLIESKYKYKYFATKGDIINYYNTEEYPLVNSDLGWEGVKNHIDISLEKITVRQAMQWIGTDLFRDRFHPQTWCNALFSEYKNLTHTEAKEKYKNTGIAVPPIEYPNWIISDVRFKNEAKAIKDRGGLLIRVEGRYYYDSLEDYLVFHPDKTVSKKASKIVANHIGEYHTLESKLNSLKEARGFFVSRHKSETDLDDYKGFDYIIDNSEGIPELIEKVKDILIKLNLI